MFLFAFFQQLLLTFFSKDRVGSSSTSTLPVAAAAAVVAKEAAAKPHAAPPQSEHTFAPNQTTKSSVPSSSAATPPPPTYTSPQLVPQHMSLHSSISAGSNALSQSWNPNYGMSQQYEPERRHGQTQNRFAPPPNHSFGISFSSFPPMIDFVRMVVGGIYFFSIALPACFLFIGSTTSETSISKSTTTSAVWCGIQISPVPSSRFGIG